MTDTTNDDKAFCHKNFLESKIKSEIFESIYDSKVCAVITCNEKGLICSANGKAEEILGYSEGELLRKKAYRFIPHEEYKKIINAITTEEDTYSYEYKVFCKNGSISWLSGMIKRVCKSDGTFLFFILFNDITHTKEVTEEQLCIMKKNEQNENVIYGVASMYKDVYYCNLDEDTYVNVYSNDDSFLDIDKGEHFSKAFNDFVNKDVAEEDRKCLKHLFKPKEIYSRLLKNKAFEFEFKVIDIKKEAYIWMRGNVIVSKRHDNGLPYTLILTFTNIDKQKIEQLKLEAENEYKRHFFQNVYHTLSVGVSQYFMKQDGHAELYSINNSGAQILGFANSEAMLEGSIGTGMIFKGMPFRAGKEFVKRMNMIKSVGDKTSFKIELVNHMGKLKYLDIYAICVLNDERKPIIQCIFKDITEEKKVKEREALENTLARLAMKRANIYDFIYYPEFKRVELSERTAEAYSAERIFENAPYSLADFLINREYYSDFFKMFMSCASGEKTVSGEFKIKNYDYWYRITLVTVTCDDYGHPSIVAGILENITEQKNIELENIELAAERKEQQKRLIRVLKTVYQAEANVKLEEKKITVTFFGDNEKMPSVCDEDYDKWLDKKILLYTNEQTKDEFKSFFEFERIYKTAYCEAEVSEENFKVYSTDGLKCWKFSIVYDRTDEDVSVTFLLMDSTDEEQQKRLIEQKNEQLKNALEEAEAANKAKSIFLANMSHEIRTPINAILGMDEIILREYDDPILNEYALNINNAGKTLLSLINDILDFSKIESGKMELNPVEYTFSSILDDITNIIKVRADEKDLILNLEISDNIPYKLYGDEIRIKQAMLNILTNAVKYTHEGSITLTVSSEYTDDENVMLNISVKDTGIGIRQEDLVHLFAKFERIDQEKNRNIEGTGLGMSITVAILELMNSKLEVESVYGKGSTFSFKISQRVIDKSPMGDFKVSYEKGVIQHRYYRESFVAPRAEILVVDDNAMNLAVVKGLLKKTKIRITTASDGETCLELVKKRHFHIIFMDHMMPKMDGIETLERMKKQAENLCKDSIVIALTANAISGMREMYLEKGFNDYMSKPVDGLKLEKLIKKYLPKELMTFTEDIPLRHTKEDVEVLSKLYKYDISLKNGLSYFNDNHEQYKEIVKLFCEDSGKKRALMLKCVECENMKDYAVYAHAVKSDSRTIGADKLAEIAYLHEVKGKTNDFAYILENLKIFFSEWDLVLEGFKLYLKMTDEDDTLTDCNENKDELKTERFKEELNRVIEFLDDFDTDNAVETLELLLTYALSSNEEKIVKAALKAIKDFDEDKALEICKNGIESLEK